MATVTRIAKWGNSLGLRLPKSVALEAQVDEGDTVDVSVKNGAIVIRPSRPTLRQKSHGKRRMRYFVSRPKIVVAQIAPPIRLSHAFDGWSSACLRARTSACTVHP